MEAKAIGRYLRISPLKLRKVINQIRDKSVKEAFFILKNLPNKAAKMAYKVLNSAVANYKQLSGEATLDLNEIKVKIAFVNQAPVLRRIMPRARGRADVLRKQSSHLFILVEKK
ncbi:MAG: 50S ribosomal protein L22 [Brevinematales bacterium]|nr:50S ribosomal protein L22 [Brevinematales bacterium]